MGLSLCPLSRQVTWGSLGPAAEVAPHWQAVPVPPLAAGKAPSPAPLPNQQEKAESQAPGAVIAAATSLAALVPPLCSLARLHLQIWVPAHLEKLNALPSPGERCTETGGCMGISSF